MNPKACTNTAFMQQLRLVLSFLPFQTVPTINTYSSTTTRKNLDVLSYLKTSEAMLHSKVFKCQNLKKIERVTAQQS